ncbi:unnamed protein product [Caenorhabditis sp. 36 PRJEB53466]|nr:unnamed protein product [Caenorhabditis sp. 36 PRJEB53466]
MFLISSSGFLVNLYILIKMRARLKDANEFTKLSLAKTIPNMIVCAAFLFWAAPLSTFQVSQPRLPLFLNVLIGQITGYGAYIAGPCILFLTASNRWFSMFFPFYKLPVRGGSVTRLSLCFVVLIALFFTISGMVPLQEELECPTAVGTVSTISIICLDLTSNSINLTILLKLGSEKVGGLSTHAMKNRRKKSLRMFMQSVTQDCLHIVDIINWQFIAGMRHELWWEFIFYTMSLLTIHAFDGFVILYFQTGVHPKFFRKSKTLQNSSMRDDRCTMTAPNPSLLLLLLLSLPMLVAIAVTALFLVSSSGFLVNFYLFLKLLPKFGSAHAFTKLCVAKTVPNMLVCAGFLFWSAPLSTFQVSMADLPVFPNVLIGQTIAYGAYIAGPCILFLVATNRWFAMFFPFYKPPIRGGIVINGLLVVVLIVALFFTIRGMIPLSCGFLYNPQRYLWVWLTYKRADCATNVENANTISIVCLELLSNSLNLTTLLKLCSEKVGGLSTHAMKSRRKRRNRMFTQSVTQDCLHLVDIINWQLIVGLNSDVYFSFIFSTMSLLSIHAFDGFVILYFQTEVHPKFVRKTTTLKKAKSSTIITLT